MQSDCPCWDGRNIDVQVWRSLQSPADFIKSKKMASLSCLRLRATSTTAFGDRCTNWSSTETSAGKLSALYVQSEIRIKSRGSGNTSSETGSSQSSVWNPTLDDGAGRAAAILCVIISSTSGRSVRKTEHWGSSSAKAIPTTPHPDPSSRTWRGVLRGFCRRSESTEMGPDLSFTIRSRYITNARAASLASEK